MNGLLCSACGRACNKLRNDTLGEGFCQSSLKPRAALACAHFGEEPCISGTAGSGTVFFSGCTLKCVFCQNYCISHRNAGHDLTAENLAEIFKNLENSGVHNINLVNPTHYTVAISDAVKIYKPHIPVVYNTNSYELPETIKRVCEWTDIFLADLKLISPSRCRRYLGAENYFDTASRAIDIMLRLKPQNLFDNDIMLNGVIIRILVLPCNVDEACAIADFIADKWGNRVMVSVMSQYYPAGPACAQYPEINRPITAREYNKVCDYYISRGFSNGYFQQWGNAGGAMTPDFNGQGVIF